MGTVGLLSSASFADQVTIGAEIAPIANLVVLGGNTNMDMDDLVTVTGADADNCVGAVKFFVNTNMPKWNIYLAFANGGILRNQNGSLDLTAAFLDFDADLNVNDDNVPTNTTVATGAAVDIAVDPDVSTIQSMLALVDASALTASTTNWFEASDVNVFGVDLVVAANGETPPTLAGAYTETVYITLATTY